MDNNKETSTTAVAVEGTKAIQKAVKEFMQNFHGKTAYELVSGIGALTQIGTNVVENLSPDTIIENSGIMEMPKNAERQYFAIPGQVGHA